MRFSVTCMENGEIYTEETFDELENLYDDDEITDNSISLDFIEAEVDRQLYKNEDVVDMENIETIEEMIDLIDTLETIEELDYEEWNKLNAIMDYNGNQNIDGG